MDAVKTERVLRNLELMLRCEDAVAEFYQTCASTWPRESEFWNELVTGGLVRSARLLLMRNRVEDSESAADSIRLFPPAALTTFLAWVERSLARVRSGEIGRYRALSIARDVERSPIVNEQFLLSRATDPDLANSLLSFSEDTTGLQSAAKGVLTRPSLRPRWP